MAKIVANELPLRGAMQIEPFVSEDQRGKFVKLSDAGFRFGTKEIFYSVNRKNSLRGLHYLLPSPQARMVFCTKGSIYDVIVDLRKSSPTFAKWHAEELSEKNGKGLLIPKGFAHGFLCLEEGSTVLYMADEDHAVENDRGIAFDDPQLRIPWPLAGSNPIVSARDAAFPKLKDAKVYD